MFNLKNISMAVQYTLITFIMRVGFGFVNHLTVYPEHHLECLFMRYLKHRAQTSVISTTQFLFAGHTLVGLFIFFISTIFAYYLIYNIEFTFDACFL